MRTPAKLSDWAEASPYPISALVSWSYGNFTRTARRGNSEGYRKIRSSVTVDPSLLPAAISRTWRATEDVNGLLNEALPANAGAYLEALNFFAQINQPDASLAVWQRLIDLKKPFDLSKTFAFFNTLIANDRARDACACNGGRRLPLWGCQDARGSIIRWFWDGDFYTGFRRMVDSGWYRDLLRRGSRSASTL